MGLADFKEDSKQNKSIARKEKMQKDMKAQEAKMNMEELEQTEGVSLTRASHKRRRVEAKQRAV